MDRDRKETNEKTLNCKSMAFWVASILPGFVVTSFPTLAVYEDAWKARRSRQLLLPGSNWNENTERCLRKKHGASVMVVREGNLLQLPSTHESVVETLGFVWALFRVLMCNYTSNFGTLKTTGDLSFDGH